MRIAVCVKHVPEGLSRIDPSTKRLDRSGEGALNHFDANAVEEALRLKGDSDTEVVAISLGPQKALDSLRKALAMGADRAVLVSDDAAAGSDLVATSRLLAAALEREEADLVLFGQQASDADGAVLWAAVAERLGRPVVSQAMELAVDGGSVRVKRQTEFGYDTLEAPLPAVVAVSDAINEPRYPSLKGIMGAKKKPQDVVSLADLGVAAGDVGEPGSCTTVLALGDGDVGAVVAGPGSKALAGEAGKFGAVKVWVCEDEDVAQPVPQPRVDVLAQVIDDGGYDTLLFANSVLAADVAAGLAARLDAGLNWDLTDIELRDGELVGKRPALKDSIYADVGWTSTPRLAKATSSPRWVASIRSTTFRTWRCWLSAG